MTLNISMHLFCLFVCLFFPPTFVSNFGRWCWFHFHFSEPKSRSSFALYVRGNKFLMDATGKTMLRVPQRSKKPGFNELPLRNLPLKRIDIGGVTFVQKSTNVLVRTNTHNARSLLRWVWLCVGMFELVLSDPNSVCSWLDCCKNCQVKC